jgi:hypothetical protein
MALFDDPPLHDFPDRAIRRLLADPANLHDLIEAVLPELVERFDFTRVEEVGREFLLEDWRRRESDLLFRLPFRAPADATEQWALVCVLIEHQSEADAAMPLRVLLYSQKCCRGRCGAGQERSGQSCWRQRGAVRWK